MPLIVVPTCLSLSPVSRRTEGRLRRPPSDHVLLRAVAWPGSSFVRLNLEAMLNCSKKPPKGMRGPVVFFKEREREREPQDPRRCFGTPKTYQLGCLLWLLFWAAFDLQVSKNLCTDPQVVAQVMMAQPNPDPVGSGSGA